MAWGSKKKVLSGEIGQELSKITLASIHFGAVHKCCRFNERGGLTNLKDIMNSMYNG